MLLRLLPLLPLPGIALASPCPPPAPASLAALSPDGGAHVITASDTTACWWFVDDKGDAEVVRHFDLAQSRPTGIRWDEERQSICIDLADAGSGQRTRVVPAPSVGDATAWRVQAAR